MSEMQTLGWREWVGLPALGIDRIKAKVDTGARTSALHAFELEVRDRSVVFALHPVQRNDSVIVRCEAPLLEMRTVRDSGGHEEQRCVIATEVRIGDDVRRVEVTLTNRDSMAFRMLLGRTSISGDYVVDPGASFLLGEPSD